MQVGTLPEILADTNMPGRTGRPVVTLSYAQSLDGCIAFNREHRLNLSGPASLKATHQLRAANDGILVGIGTVLADNPCLTVRLVEGKNPRPVVLDSHLRLPLDSNLLKNGHSCPLVATTPNHDVKRRQELEQAGVKVLCVPCDNRGWVDLDYLLSSLLDLGIGTLMVEGGAKVITSFLSKRVVDRLVITITPKLVGGLHAVENPLVSFDGNVNDGSQLPELTDCGYGILGEDMVFWSKISWRDK